MISFSTYVHTYQTPPNRAARQPASSPTVGTGSKTTQPFQPSAPHPHRHTHTIMTWHSATIRAPLFTQGLKAITGPAERKHQHARSKKERTKERKKEPGTNTRPPLTAITPRPETSCTNGETRVPQTTRGSFGAPTTLPIPGPCLICWLSEY